MRTITAQLHTNGFGDRDIDIRQGMAVTGITLGEARWLVENLPGIIESAELIEETRDDLDADDTLTDDQREAMLNAIRVKLNDSLLTVED